jgi:hypothetical protein
MIAFCARLFPSSVVLVFIVVERNYTVREDAHTFSPVVSMGPSPTLVSLRKKTVRAYLYITVKKMLTTFPSPAGMLLTKLSLGGNN